MRVSNKLRVQSKGSLLKITDSTIKVLKLNPSIFKDSKVAGIDALHNGNLLIANRGPDKVAIVSSDLTPIKLFSKSGSDPGELDGPRTLTATVNNRIYVADRGNK
jgi:hypothetical protein